MTQHSLLKAFKNAFVVTFLAFLLPFFSISQANYGCPISIDGAESLSSIRSAPMEMSMITTYATPFEDLENIRGWDNQFSEVDLEAKKSSDLLYVNNFGFSLPEGVAILGLDVRIVGEASIPNVIRDTRVSLASGPGISIGSDKANRSIANKPWGETSTWTYGSVMDDWGADLSPSTVNNPGFGLLLQISNRASEKVRAEIDQISIRIYYQASLEICGHPCIAVQSFPDPEVVSYAWNVDSGLVSEVSNQQDNIVNIFADQSPFGEYEICLSRNFADGTMDNCCRSINYHSCEQNSSIGDRIWEDYNGNGIQDPGEPGLDNVIVRLYDSSGQEIANTISVNGNYNFNNLPPGSYYIRVDLNGFVPSNYVEGDNDNNSDFQNIYFYGTSGIIELGSGENRTDIDFGLTRYGSICGHAYNDRNGDGWENGVDVPLTWVTVRLYDLDCNLLRTVETDDNGDYCIDEVIPGNYFIAIELRPGFFPSAFGFNNVIDPVTGKIMVEVPYGETSDGNDIGAFRLSSIGDFVWSDDNGNGIQDVGESGIAGATVALYTCNDVFVKSTTTDANGNYLLAALNPGSFKVCVEGGPVGYSPTIKSADPLGSDISADGCTECLEILDNTDIVDLDAGLTFNASDIGDLVWFDENGNGVMDQGEQGIGEVTVTLQDCSGNTVATTMTDASGSYLFTSVPSGDYIICLTEEYRDYIPSLTTGCSDCFSHSGNMPSLNQDFSLVYELATVDTKVWIDENGDGIRDDDEERVAGIVSELYTCDGTFVTSAPSDNIGGTWFVNIAPGDYYVRAIIDPSYQFITNGGQITGQNGVGTSDCFSVLGFGRTISIGLTREVTPVLSQICSRVWDDENANNVLDAGEQFLPNLTVNIHSCQGQLVDSVQSGGASAVCLADLAQGDYYLSLNLPDGYEAVSGGSITNQNGQGTTSCFSVTGQTINVDLGLKKVSEAASITAILWEDTEVNGILDAGERLLSDVSVSLYSCQGIFIEETFSATDGTVSFGNTLPGSYYIQTELIPGLEFLPGGIITHSIATGTTDCFDVTPNGTSIDIVYVDPNVIFSASISGTVWLDGNEDGMMDLVEVGMEQVSVNLYDENFSNLQTTTTDELGKYTFIDLDFGSYYIQFVTPGNYSFTEYRAGNISQNDSEVFDPQLGMTDIVTLITPTGMTDINAGLVESEVLTSEVNGRIWVDENLNGLIDNNESGWAESLVVLYEENGTYHSSTFSDDEGYYNFPLLPVGRYYLDFELPNGFNYSPARVGGVSQLDSEVLETVFGTTLVFELFSAQGLTGINAGLQRITEEFVSISGRGWIDADRNNLLDVTEDGYPEMLVVLYEGAGIYHSATFTDDEGFYNFQQIDAGSYYIEFELPDGFEYSAAQVANNNLDSEVVDFIEGTTASYNLNPGDVLEDINVGLQETKTEPSSISGKVWVDSDENNQDDGAELGYTDMLVILFDADNNFVASTYTNEEGNFMFAQLDAGEYYVDFELPDGFTYSDFRAGNNQIDSEVEDFLNGISPIYVLTDGENLIGINAGLQLEDVATSSIAGTVWVDDNDNSILDNGEEGYGDLLVILNDEFGNFMASTFTNEEGNYIFPLLNSGRYIVDFDLPSDYTFTPARVAGVSDFDSEVTDLIVGTTDVIEIFTIGVTGINAGLKSDIVIQDPASITGRVWSDDDADGMIGVFEPGIEGVEVQLYDDQNSLVATVTTIWSGHYEFTNLSVGLYYVRFDLQRDGFSLPQAGGVSNLDSEVVNTVNGNTGLYFLDSSEQLGGINAGMIQEQIAEPSSISGRVWLDVDEDGMIGNSELGRSGIAVSLVDDNNIVVEQKVTSPDGSYLFNNLTTGLYYLKFDSGTYKFSAPRAGGNSTEDSEVVNGVDGHTQLYVIDAGQDLIGINAGLIEIANIELGSISGLTWIDENEDGLANASELGAEKISVTLFNDSNVEVASVVTTWTGKYEFTGLTAGQYYVNFLSSDYNFTTPLAGGNSIWDSEVVNAVDGNTSLYTLGVGEDIEGINAGVILLPGSVRGMVWMDSDRDGFISQGEDGVSSVVVHLIDVNNEIVESQTTSDDGIYEFTELRSGMYYFRYEIPETSFFTISQAGTNSDLDSEVVNFPNANTGLFVLQAGQDISGINAGIYELALEPASIAGSVWLDEDRDGLISGAELGIEDVAVELYDENNLNVVSAITDINGDYNFDGIDPGLYYIKFDISDDYNFTSVQAGGNSLIDSEVRNTIDGKTKNYVLSNGQDLQGVNAGLVEKEIIVDNASLSGLVWEDVNGDGILDTDEFGYSGVAVRLLDSNDNLLSIISTNSLGEYNFSGLDAGNYYVQFTLPLDAKATYLNAGMDENLDSDITFEGKTEIVTINSGNVSGVNAGYYYPVSIGNWVWMDINEDGMQSPDEPGANNYIINLYDADGNFLERVWSNYNEDGQAGYYNFNDLRPGSYYIKVSTQAGLSFSPSGQTVDELDSDLTGANGFGSSNTIFLASGTSTEDIDIGLVLAPADVGDRLWIDANGDGIQDDVENGLNGVVVELYNSFDILVGTTETSSKDGEDGYYLFEEIYPTEYYLRFLLSDEYITTAADIGGVDSKDSDIDNSNGPGTTSIFLLSPGETDLDLDGGVYFNAFIGDKVWHDRNLDGVQDSNEPGVENVGIDLYKVINGESVYLASTVTDRFGEYRFPDLANGDYILAFLPPDDFEMTEMDMGNDDTEDSDASKTGVTDIVSITNNTSMPNVDVGLVRPDNQISGYVWLDINKNGTYETDETLVKGITIWLMKGTQLMAEEVSGPGGRYLFDDLANDDYYMKVDLPSEFDFTTPNFGIEEDVDSDFDNDGNSETFSFTGEDVYRNINLGLIDISKKRSVLYPNPLIGSELNVSTHIYKKDLTASYQLLGSMGQLLGSGKLDNRKTEGTDQFSIPIEELDAGIYFLKLQVGRQVENIKFTKLSR